MDRKFETTYSQDYTHRLENRQLALYHKIDANLPGSCFSPPFECTVPVFSMDNRAGESPLKSSYQLDYDRLPERTSCVIKNAFESSRWPDSRYFQREFKGIPCNGASCQSSTRGPHQICSHEPGVETKRNLNLDMCIPYRIYPKVILYQVIGLIKIGNVVHQIGRSIVIRWDVLEELCNVKTFTIIVAVHL
ncbi:uncharacterized protein LOC121602670 [Anopheles merus]|uniref:uncharacterized protein LOC121602670 n=1 Tax=Anopheles merus TaxID=30066 RepID=UPI001BE3FF76|nr:uncharacterized protein LOC121602670 [Anopheles merus]